jgi:MFS family permease
LLPGYASIGIGSPGIFIRMRMLQGLAIGGEYGGAATYVAEHAPAVRRSFYTAWIQTTATLGLFLSLLVTVGVRTLLVEMFPTRVRYTSMSLPFHIGNGWFGGFLPATAFAIVAANGNIYSGLWYPVVIALATFVIGMLFMKETKDSDIYAEN